MTVAQKMTAREFVELPSPPRARFHELVDGEVVVTDPLLLHQRAVGEVLYALTTWYRAAAGRGEATLPIDVLIDDHNVYKPDVAWYSRGAPSQEIPDLAVEIRSPSTWRYDIGAKKAGYERAGVRELWLVDTAADVVLVFRRSKPEAREFDVSLELARGDALTSPLLPSFALAVDQVFGTG